MKVKTKIGNYRITLSCVRITIFTTKQREFIGGDCLLLFLIFVFVPGFFNPQELYKKGRDSIAIGMLGIFSTQFLVFFWCRKREFRTNRFLYKSIKTESTDPFAVCVYFIREKGKLADIFSSASKPIIS